MSDLHTKLIRILLACLLSIIGTIEVVSGDGALRASHVSTDDEMRGSIVLANDHVLDGFARTRHFHAVWQICPAEHRILLLCLLTQSFVCLNADDTINVARLR